VASHLGDYVRVACNHVRCLPGIRGQVIEAGVVDQAPAIPEDCSIPFARDRPVGARVLDNELPIGKRLLLAAKQAGQADPAKYCSFGIRQPGELDQRRQYVLYLCELADGPLNVSPRSALRLVASSQRIPPSAATIRREARFTVVPSNPTRRRVSPPLSP
jgi:hypothetical protein